MYTNELSDVKEDYLRAIYLISQQKSDGVRITDLSKYLGLRKSTVSERVSDIAEMKLIIVKKYSPIQFTAKGLELAKLLTYRHRIIEVFLFQKLGFPKSKLHQEADRLEHGFSYNSIRRLAKFLRFPTLDPHGQKIKK